MRASIPWESSNEKAFLLRAELDPTVRCIYAQAVRLAVPTADGTWNHIPDFVIATVRGVEVHEVKPDADADDAGMRALFSLAARRVRLHGAVYSVARESALKAQPVFSALITLHRHLHDQVPPALTSFATEIAQAAGRVPAGRLASETACWGGSLQAMYALVAQGVLRMDLAAPLGSDALVWSPDAFPGEPRLLPLNVPPEPTL